MRRLIVVLAAAAVALVVSTAATGGASSRNVQMLDDCDDSFNQVIGEGTCAKDGGTSFFEFVDQLVTQGRAPAWRFAPDRMSLAADGTITAWNRGGEFHTFTEVAEYGGGCVDELNELLGLEPVEECNDPSLFGTTGAGPGESVTTVQLAAGTHRFMCLIHPWMQTTATAS
jgi:plastocyanin